MIGSLSAGTHVKIEGIPFELIEDTSILGTRGNLEAIGVGKNMFTPEIRPEILSFAEQMEQQMRKHDPDYGDNWISCSSMFLERRLLEKYARWLTESEELCLVDVANFAMMLWSRRR